MPRRLVSDLMSGTVCSVPESATVLEAVRLMSDRHIGAVVIVEDGDLKGIFTERDALARVMAEGRSPDDTPVTSVMTQKPRTAIPQISAVAALLMMRDGFLAPNVNLENVDPACEHLRIVTEASNSLPCKIGMSNSFGFGGTNACLVLGVS